MNNVAIQNVPAVGHATQIRSSSSGRIYSIRMGRDARMYCTCPAWKFSKGPIKTCKHLHAFLTGRVEQKGKFVMVSV